MSAELQSLGREGLDEAISIVPAGGLDKVTSFVSLLRGSKLSIMCLLNTFTDQKGKKRLDDLVREKIVRDKQILFFDAFAEVGSVADLEDVFSKEEYLSFFHAAFNGEFPEVKLANLNPNDRILPQINKIIGRDRFNHYRPAKQLVAGVKTIKMSAKTLERCESIFKVVNDRSSA